MKSIQSNEFPVTSDQLSNILEIDAISVNLRKCKIRKPKSQKKSKQRRMEAELSVLKLRNTVIRMLAGVSEFARGFDEKAKSTEAPISAIINSLDNNLIKDVKTNQNLDHFFVNKKKLSEHELATDNSQNELTQELVAKARSYPARLIASFLQESRTSNKSRIQELLKLADINRVKVYNEESLFARHPSLLKSQVPDDALFLNNISESDIFYDLRSKFAIEDRYIDTMETSAKRKSIKILQDYNSNS